MAIALSFACQLHQLPEPACVRLDIVWRVANSPVKARSHTNITNVHHLLSHDPIVTLCVWYFCIKAWVRFCSTLCTRASVAFLWTRQINLMPWYLCQAPLLLWALTSMLVNMQISLCTDIPSENCSEFNLRCFVLLLPCREWHHLLGWHGP